MSSFWQIFWSFFKIGLFTFGGGLTMLPLIHREVIQRRKWIAGEEFTDLVALAQSIPGPIALNTAVYIGYKVRGYRGAVAATLGVVIPSFMVILAVATLFADISHNPIVEAAFKGMRPVVVALIFIPVLSLSKGMHLSMLIVVAATAFVVWWWGLSPMYLIPAAALCGIAWSLLFIKKVKK